MKHFWDNPEDFTNDKIICYAWVATAIIGSAAIGAATTAYSANKAASAQTSAANTASQTQLQAAQLSNQTLQDQYNQTRSDLSSYRDIGNVANNQITNNLAQYTTPIPVSQAQQDLQKPIDVNQSTLESLPGYQFSLQQGLKATQNAAAARGLGVSGAALKGAATFATGLADSNYANYFNQQQTNVNNAFNRYQTVYGDQTQQQGAAFDRLNSLLSTGEGAAAQTSVLGNKTATSQSANTVGAGNSVASNTIGAGNAVAAATNATGNAVSNAANSIGGYYAYNGLYGNVGNMPATGIGSPSDAASNAYARSVGINPNG